MSKRAQRKKERRDAAMAPQMLGGWQRCLIWMAWLGVLVLMFANSANTILGWKEWGGLSVAVGITFLCKLHPMGGPQIVIRQASEVRGSFESRTNWALVLVGALLSLGGIAAIVKMVQDWRAGLVTVGGIFSDMAVFVIEWCHERISGGIHDGQLEKTHGYILFILLLPGLFMFFFCLMPWLYRGLAWRVGTDETLTVWYRGAWVPLQEEEFSLVIADGITIEFKESEAAASAAVLPQDRVYSRELNTRVPDKVLAQYFRERLEKRGFVVESWTPDGSMEVGWIARKRNKPEKNT